MDCLNNLLRNKKKLSTIFTIDTTLDCETYWREKGWQVTSGFLDLLVLILKMICYIDWANQEGWLCALLIIHS